jgi:hypothetical protein
VGREPLLHEGLEVVLEMGVGDGEGETGRELEPPVDHVGLAGVEEALGESGRELPLAHEGLLVSTEGELGRRDENDE